MKYVIFIMCLFAFDVSASTNVSECISLRGDVGKAMFFSMLDDLGIKETSVDKERTDVKIISESPVSFALAETYGVLEKKLSGENSEDKTTVDEYAYGFMKNHTKNMIIEYSFSNKKNMKNVFLASVFVSDTDCIVRFNNYIIVRRGF